MRNVLSNQPPTNGDNNNAEKRPQPDLVPSYPSSWRLRARFSPLQLQRVESAREFFIALFNVCLAKLLVVCDQLIQSTQRGGERDRERGGGGKREDRE